jgi:hypothetical protein
MGRHARRRRPWKDAMRQAPASIVITDKAMNRLYSAACGSASTRHPSDEHLRGLMRRDWANNRRLDP